MYSLTFVSVNPGVGRCDSNAVQELSNVRDVTVTLEKGHQFCSVAGSVTKISFNLPQGDIPDLVLTQSATFDATIALFTEGSASAIEVVQCLYSPSGSLLNTVCAYITYVFLVCSWS
jgi:hypothetical protein